MDMNDLTRSKITEWRRIVTTCDWDALPPLLADEVTYHNPAQAEPLRGKEALVGTLRLVFSIFEDFEYERHFDGSEGHVLEFSGRVGEVPFTGIDILSFDEANRIVDLVVMIRPISAVIRLGEEAARLLADTHGDGGVQ